MGRTSGGGGRVGASYANSKPVRLGIESEPQRPINGSYATARALMEIKEWSQEAFDAVSGISEDVFISSDGADDSWSVVGVKAGREEEDREPIDENIKAVVKDLKQRRFGKSYVIGGTKAQKAAAQVLENGDSFLSVRFDREGTGRNPSDWYVAETNYLDPMRTFVLEDIEGREAGYVEKGARNEDDREFSLYEVLHFTYRDAGHYGQSPFVSRIPHWDVLKRALPATEAAIIDAGSAPWLHIMPEDCDDKARDEYEEQHTEAASQGVIKNLYLNSGTEVRKAANNDEGAQQLIETWLELRRAMVPMGLPDYFFSLPSRSTSRDLNNQPAMKYARIMAHMRSRIGEQIKMLCDMEVIIKLGVDYYREHPFEIGWPKWDITPPQRMEIERPGSQQQGALNGAGS